MHFTAHSRSPLAALFATFLAIVPVFASADAQVTRERARALAITTCSGMPGDLNHDDSVNSADVFRLIHYLFAGGVAPLGDASTDGDDNVDVSDVFYLINHLYAHGPAPRCTSWNQRTAIDVSLMQRSMKSSTAGQVTLFCSDACDPWTGPYDRWTEPAGTENYCGPTAGMNILNWYGVTSTYSQLASDMNTNSWMSAFDAVGECTLYCLGEPLCSTMCYGVTHTWLNAGTLPADLKSTLTKYTPPRYRPYAGVGNPNLTIIENELREGDPTVALLWFDEGSFGRLHWVVVTGTYELNGTVMMRLANESPLSWAEFVQRWSFSGMSVLERDFIKKKNLVAQYWIRYDKTTELRPGESLQRGGTTSVTSHDGRFRLVLTSDGNLILYSIVGSYVRLWHTNTANTYASEAVMQTDGNLVVYNSGGAVWSTHTYGHPGAYLALQNDGNLVVYGPDNTSVLWASNTCCH